MTRNSRRARPPSPLAEPEAAQKRPPGLGTTAVDSGLTVTDADSTNLFSATVTISANYVNGQDTLGFTNQNGIVGSWDAPSGVLTLVGKTTVVDCFRPVFPVLP